jgi:hypothetical protein
MQRIRYVSDFDFMHEKNNLLLCRGRELCIVDVLQGAVSKKWNVGERISAVAVADKAPIAALAVTNDEQKRAVVAWDLRTGKVLITVQNHGFCVDIGSLKSDDIEITHINLNDQTLEGVRHKKFPVFSVQFHPEAAHIVVGCLGSHHLNRATRQAGEQRPHGTRAAPVDRFFQRGGHNAHIAGFLL